MPPARSARQRRRHLVDVPVDAGPQLVAFPSDGFKADGLTVRGAQTYSGVAAATDDLGRDDHVDQRPDHAGSVNGNSTADFLVTFKSTGSAVLLAWGGHLAQSAYWDKAAGGQRDGAGQVSGAPVAHADAPARRSGNKNQDRSIQPSAIVGELPPLALGPARHRGPTAARRRAAPRATPRPTPAPGSGGGTPNDADGGVADPRADATGDQHDRWTPRPPPPTAAWGSSQRS